MGFYTHLEKCAANYYSPHLPEDDRLRVYTSEKEQMSKRERTSGGWRTGALAGGVLGGIYGGIRSKSHLGAAVSGAAGAGLGALVGSLHDSSYNENTERAKHFLSLSPEERRAFYRHRYAEALDSRDHARDSRQERIMRATERQAYGKDGHVPGYIYLRAK